MFKPSGKQLNLFVVFPPLLAITSARLAAGDPTADGLRLLLSSLF
nr:hypothetical protein [Evansella caseinilytica]